MSARFEEKKLSVNSRNVLLIAGIQLLIIRGRGERGLIEREGERKPDNLCWLVITGCWPIRSRKVSYRHGADHVCYAGDCYRYVR